MGIPADGIWRKSSFSAWHGSCVEVRVADGKVQVRDTKDRGGPVLAFSPGAWAAFLTASRPGA